MKFKVKGSAFLSSVKTVSKAIINKPVLDILENIRFDIDDDTLRLTASDTQTTIAASCPIETEGKHDPFVIAAKPLAETLQGLNTSNLEFDLTSDNCVTVTWPEGEVRIPMMNAQDWPEMESNEETELEATIDSSVLESGLRTCDFATAKDDLVLALQGLLLEFSGHDLNVVASNQRIMAITEIKDVNTDRAATFVLHKRSSGILCGLLHTSEKTSMTLRQNSATFRMEDSGITITCRLVDGRFPSWRSLVSSVKGSTLEVNKDKLIEIWKRINGCTSSTSRGLRMDIYNNAVSLSAEDFSTQIAGTESMTCSYDGEPMTIGFNTEMFSMILSNTPGDTVTFTIYNESKAVMVKDGMNSKQMSFTGIIMPIHLTN